MDADGFEIPPSSIQRSSKHQAPMTVIRKKRIIVSAVVFVAAVAAAVLWQGERDPKYQGRKLSEWVEIYREHAVEGPEVVDSPEGWIAIRAVRQIRDQAIPVAIRAIQYEEPAWQTKVREFCVTQRRHVPQFLWIEACSKKKYLGNELFEMLGPEGAPAIPELLRLVNGRPSGLVAYRALFAMSEMREAGVQPLMKVLMDKKNADRYYAAEAISALSDRLGKQARQKMSCVLPSLIEIAARDPDPDVRGIAALTLRSVVPELEPEEVSVN
jgi:hypothetical protein